MFVLCFAYLHRLYNTSLIIKLVSRKYYENGFYSPYNGYKMFVPTRRGSAKNNVTFFFTRTLIKKGISRFTLICISYLELPIMLKYVT